MKINEWKLFNQLGQLIADQKADKRFLDISSVSPGIYFYEIILNGNPRYHS